MAALEEPPEVATTGEASELPYDGDISAAMKAQDRAAIKVIMEARKNQKGKSPVKDASAAEEQDGEGGSAAAASAAEQKLCPICSEMRDDVELLEHATNIKGDISDHQACGYCRANMIRTNASCPWCRTEMVWRNLYGFLDGLKGSIGGSAAKGTDHQSLANLLTFWQEYEMTRSRSDLAQFAKDLCTDSSLAAHVKRGLEQQSPWLRDSAGLWLRLYGMQQDGEIELDAEEATRLETTVESCFSIFENNHGGHEDFIAAWYQQACTALLCAMLSGSSTTTLIKLVQRAGGLTVSVFDAHYTNKSSALGEVRSKLNPEYVQAVEEMVWNGAADDPVWNKFFAS
mmetsp:Transcript_11650/g.20401  ORF Transcript_11650/g.20401 Transcript_11650/m.20401 type:complete len:343 (-) Transcript_11650:172-1200(-)